MSGLCIIKAITSKLLYWFRIDKKTIDNNKIHFNLASVSKQFTVFAILLIEQEGKLSLDD